MEDGKEVVFQNITDLYIAVRQSKHVSVLKDTAVIIETTSHSWGSNVRELVKEIAQSQIELQDFLRERRPHGNSS